jgi:hypothetical protein
MPGPGAAFSLAGTARAGALLSGSGFGGIEFVKAGEPMLTGRDVDDVLAYELTSSTATEILTRRTAPALAVPVHASSAAQVS